MNETTSQIEDFNFFEQITKEDNYISLYPEQKVGLTIMKLYSKMQQGYYTKQRFKEKDIHQALEEVLKLDGNTYKRIPSEYFNDKVMLLQKYFLKYDEDEKLYSFKDYAYKFCENAEERLKSNFNPTQVEIICNELRRKLEECEAPIDIENWIEIHFKSFKPRMKSQVDFLDRQIDISVEEIRESTQLSNEAVINTLRQIDGKLDDIRLQNKELRAAFRELSAVYNKLEDLSIRIDDQQLGNQMNDSRLFITQIKYDLSLIDKRLDRIQPKLRQFFRTLNRPLFNTKIEKFFHFLFDASQVTIQESKKVLLLPNNVYLPAIYMNTPTFTIVERKEDLFPTKQRKIDKQPDNIEYIKQVFEKFQNKIYQQDEVQSWLERIKSERKTQIQFSDFFIRIVKENEGNIETAVKVAHAMFKSGTFKNTIDIETTMTTVTFEEFKFLSLWEIILHKRL